MLSSIALFAILPSFVLGGIFTTSPVGTTTFTAGQQATVSWQDDSKAPALKDFGPAKVSIYAGNAIMQTQLQVIAPSVDVSTTSSIQFTPDASIGPNSAEYFVRFESIALKDAAAPQYPALAFSAKFNMAGMSGTFNATVQSQIDGQSTAPIAAPTGQGSASAAATTSAGATSAKAAAASASKTSSGATVSASSTPNAASAVQVSAGKWIGVACAALFGLVSL